MINVINAMMSCVVARHFGVTGCDGIFLSCGMHFGVTEIYDAFEHIVVSGLVLWQDILGCR
jgi:hypothetical protein